MGKFLRSLYVGRMTEYLFLGAIVDLGQLRSGRARSEGWWKTKA
jgi:hypothetical protein